MNDGRLVETAPQAYAQPPTRVMAQTAAPPAEEATRDPEPQVAAPAPAMAPQQIDGNSVAEALNDFCNTDFAYQLCEYCGVGPTDRGRIEGMFEMVRINENRLEVRLQRQFEQRADKLLDRLKRHLRQSKIGIVRIDYEQRSPPMTRMIIV